MIRTADSYREACADVVNTAADLILDHRFRESVDGWGRTVWVLDPAQYHELSTAVRRMAALERDDTDDTDNVIPHDDNP